MIEILAQISKTPPRAFTAGLVLQNNVVVETAPIIGYMKREHWTRDRVRAYCRERGWKIKVVYKSRHPHPRDG